MLRIIEAKETDTDLLAQMAKTTYLESHAQYIKDKNDLAEYLRMAFSSAKTSEELADPNNLFYIAYLHDLPIAYAKLVMNTKNEFVSGKNICKLERIYVLEEYIAQKVGKQVLDFLESKAKSLHYDCLWLTVYVENERAIRFYRKNNYNEEGKTSFFVNETDYQNLVFSKTLEPNTAV